MVTIEQAQQVTKRPAGLQALIKQGGITKDIISQVRQVFSETYPQSAQLATLLKGRNELESARHVFQFVRENVRYVLDPENKQLIREPADIIYNRVADCKGLAILINSLLANLEIRSSFRFVSFSRRPTVTHVYAVAHIDGKQYVLDACLPNFNQEKPFKYKEDYMTDIIRVSGFGIKAQMSRLKTRLAAGGKMTGKKPSPFSHRFANLKARMLAKKAAAQTAPLPDAQLAEGETPLNISGFESEHEMDLKLALQGLEVERAAAVSICGIGSPLVANLNSGIGRYKAAIAALENDDYEAVSAVGDAAVGNIFKKLGKKIKKVAKKAGSVVKKGAKAVAQNKLIKKVATVAKKAAKGVVKAGKFALKVVTAPMRLLVKGLAEVFIPKMAPMFLYLFITNQTTINNLPDKIKRKRKKSEKFAKFMTKVIGMKEAHFMKIVRNGIVRKHKKNPEQLLQGKIKGSINGTNSGINGIGLITEILPVVLEVIKKISALFGKKPDPDETPTADDMPDLDADFEDATPKAMRQLNAHLTHKPASQRYEEPGYALDEARELRAEESVYNQIENEPSDIPQDAPLPYPEPEPGDPEQPADDYQEYQEQDSGGYSSDPNFNQAAPQKTEAGTAPETSGSTNWLKGAAMFAGAVLGAKALKIIK